MSALTDFVTARLDEDEARLLGWEHAEALTLNGDFGSDARVNDYRAKLAVETIGFPPARIRAEIKAKRHIVDHYLNWCQSERRGPNRGFVRQDEWAQGARFELETDVNVIAQIWADHPDFHEGWRLP